MVLSEGKNPEACKTQVMNFFEQTTLVRYDNIVFDEIILSATDPKFSEELDLGLKRNRQTLRKFIDELGETGFETRSDLMAVDQGYQSKILHIIAHFLDGFVGIDSVFYNLVEDSHWLSNDTKEQIDQEPDRFNLLFFEMLFPDS
jgi:hypothetical protein